MTARIRNTTLAIIVAVIGTVLVVTYVSHYRKTVNLGAKQVYVYVAAHDISAGTSGSDAARMLTREPVPKRTVVPGAISSTTELSSLVAAERIYKGDQISTRRFRPTVEQGIVGEIKGNQRAVQIAGDANQLLAGTLKAGDRVDVLASIKYTVKSADKTAAGAQDRNRVASRIVLRDLRVLRAPDAPASGSGLSNPNQTFNAQLALSDNQAQKFFFVMRNGEWTLELRPAQNAQDSPQSVETIESVLGDGLALRQLLQLDAGIGRRNFDAR